MGWGKDGVRNGIKMGSGMGMGQSWMGIGVRDGIKMESGTGSGMGGRNGGKDGVRDWDGGQGWGWDKVGDGDWGQGWGKDGVRDGDGGHGWGWDKAGWELGPGLGSGMGDEMTGWEQEKNQDKTGRDKEHSRLGQQEKPRTGVRDGKSWSRTGTTTHLSPPSLPL